MISFLLDTFFKHGNDFMKPLTMNQKPNDIVKTNEIDYKSVPLKQNPLRQGVRS